MKPQRVVVGLSGGVDSAVSAHLLQQQGQEVIGIFMKNWEDDDDSEYCSSNIDFVDAAAVAEDGPFDLVLVLEALHDMARPDEALRAIREALAPGGSVLVADEKVGDHFHAPADDLERLMYGWSIVHCLPVAMAEQPSAAIGTVIRAATVQALAMGAGFSRVEVVPIDGGFFRLYRLRA